MPHTVRVKCTIPKKNVLMLNSIIDSYEGIGLVRTVDASKGSMVIYSTNDQYKKVLAVLEELKKDGMKIENISTEESEQIDEW
jgi:polynucleotide 5'-kinase involved in rRNA processing